MRNARRLAGQRLFLLIMSLQ